MLLRSSDLTELSQVLCIQIVSLHLFLICLNLILYLPTALLIHWLVELVIIQQIHSVLRLPHEEVYHIIGLPSLIQFQFQMLLKFICFPFEPVVGIETLWQFYLLPIGAS